MRKEEHIEAIFKLEDNIKRCQRLIIECHRDIRFYKFEIQIQELALKELHKYEILCNSLKRLQERYSKLIKA